MMIGGVGRMKVLTLIDRNSVFEKNLIHTVGPDSGSSDHFDIAVVAAVGFVVT